MYNRNRMADKPIAPIHLSLAESNGLNVQIDDCDFRFLRALKEEFSVYAENYQFHPRYQAGVWDGRICLLDTRTSTAPVWAVS